MQFFYKQIMVAGISYFKGMAVLVAACAAFSAFGADGKPAEYEVFGDIPNYGEKYLSPDFIVPASDGSILVTARTGRELLILKNDKLEGKVELGGFPSGLAVSKDAKTAYVSIAAPAGKLLKIDIAARKIAQSVPAGHMPRSVRLSADQKTLYVANQFENKVRSYDASTLQRKQEGSVVRDAFSIAETLDGKKLIVLNQIPESKGGLYEENIAAAVSILDAATLKNIANLQLPNGSINCQEVVISPDGKYAFLTHAIGRFNVPTTQVERGWISTNAVTIIDIANNKIFATFLLDDIELGAANLYGLAITPDGKLLCVAHSGSHEISIIDLPTLIKRIQDLYAKSEDKAKTYEDICNDLAFLSTIRKRVHLDGFGPRHMAIVGKNLYVGMYYSDVLNKLDLSNPVNPQKISIGGNEVLNEVRRGDLFYHDASLCFQHWLSCVTCHTEVRSDALNWDLLNDGIGNPKQSKSMLYAHYTPPSMITAVRKSAELAVRKGIQYIQFTRRPEKDAKAIDAYLKSLKAVESPHLVNGKLSEAAERGQFIFEEAGCAHCHNGEYYTDMKRHDVGTGLNEYKGFKFDTPTLCEVWRTAPYLYDGRARTIFEMLRKFNPEDKHGKTSNLSDDDLRDLEAYVLTL